MKIVIDIPKEYYEALKEMSDETLSIIDRAIIRNGTPLYKTIDSLKELSKDHRHNFVGNSCEERAWRLGIEDSIDLILAESEETYE